MLVLLKIWIQPLPMAFLRTLKNFSAVVLFTIYSIIFYLGYLFMIEEFYLYSMLLFLIFTFCISSIFYIVEKIIKVGRFTINDLMHSFTDYYIRANFLLIFWYLIFFFVNQFIITPISSIIPQPVVLYGIVVPAILVIFIIFNTLLENIYLSTDRFEKLFINSAEFIEKYWLTWIPPTLVLMLLVNLFDHRLSLLPTLGYLDADGVLLKLMDRSFYIRSFIIIFSLIYRGLLYNQLLHSDIKK